VVGPNTVMNLTTPSPSNPPCTRSSTIGDEKRAALRLSWPSSSPRLGCAVWLSAMRSISATTNSFHRMVGSLESMTPGHRHSRSTMSVSRSWITPVLFISVHASLIGHSRLRSCLSRRTSFSFHPAKDLRANPMREFFKAWRRKAGCVALVMACVFMAGRQPVH
jgi:hypothetical protein